MRIGSGDGTILCSSKLSVGDNIWPHITFTAQVSEVSIEVKVYIDGTLGNTCNSEGFVKFSGTAPLTIGVWEAFNHYGFFPGLIDDAALWCKALSESDILQIYERQKTKSSI